MTTGMRWTLLSFALLLASALAGCGHASHQTGEAAALEDRIAANPPPPPEQLEALLRAELAKQGKDGSKAASAAPSGNEDAVFDLLGGHTALRRPQDGTNVNGILLTWTEQLVGDYDENGLVNISDLTPILKYWQESLEYADPALTGGAKTWPVGSGSRAPNPALPYDMHWRLARVDGTPDGLINISDLSPIARHWGEHLSGYRLYRKGPADADFVLLSGPGSLYNASAEVQSAQLSVPRNATYPAAAELPDPDFGVHYYFFDQPQGGGPFEYYVAPYDAATDREGPPSSHLIVAAELRTLNYDPGQSLQLNATPDSGDAPLDVAYDVMQNGPISMLLFDFEGDGVVDLSTGRSLSAAHTFLAPVNASSTLWGLAGAQTYHAVFTPVTVLDNGNHVPIAALSANPTSGNAPLMVTLDATASSDVEGIASYQFDFEGDGIYDVTTATISPFDYTYAEGQYSPTVKVTDSGGLTATASVQLTVGPNLNVAPTGTLTADKPQTYAPDTITFTATGSDTDGTVQRFDIDYEDDGTYDEGVDMDGSGGPWQFVHTYQTAGTYTARLRVTDNGGSTGEATTSVELLLNSPPVAQLMADVETGPAPLTVQFDASGSSDPEGQPLTYTWDFLGTLDPQAAGAASEQYTYYQQGVRGVMVKVTDAFGASSTAAVAITTTSGWNVTTLTSDAALADNSGGPGVSLAVVNGNPAVAFVRDGSLYYAAASNADGTNWPIFVVLDVLPVWPPADPCLEVINGVPAIAYNSASNGVNYITAQDAAGTSWNSPLEVAHDGGSIVSTDLAVVDGNPAIVYINSLSRVYYLRATNPSGTAWAPLFDDGVLNHKFNETAGLEVIAGRPAITLSDAVSIKYYAALDVDGILWAPPVVAASPGPFDLAADLAGPAQPVVAFYQDGLYSAYATDAAGSSWSAPVQISPLAPRLLNLAEEVKLAPVLGVLGTLDYESHFFFSTDTLGTAWLPSNGVFDYDAPTFAFDIAEVNGTAAVAVETDRGLQFAELH